MASSIVQLVLHQNSDNASDQVANLLFKFIDVIIQNEAGLNKSNCVVVQHFCEVNAILSMFIIIIIINNIFFCYFY